MLAYFSKGGRNDRASGEIHHGWKYHPSYGTLYYIFFPKNPSQEERKIYENKMVDPAGFEPATCAL